MPEKYRFPKVTKSPRLAFNLQSSGLSLAECGLSGVLRCLHFPLDPCRRCCGRSHHRCAAPKVPGAHTESPPTETACLAWKMLNIAINIFHKGVQMVVNLNTESFVFSALLKLHPKATKRGRFYPKTENKNKEAAAHPAAGHPCVDGTALPAWGPGHQGWAPAHTAPAVSWYLASTTPLCLQTFFYFFWVVLGWTLGPFVGQPHALLGLRPQPPNLWFTSLVSQDPLQEDSCRPCLRTSVELTPSLMCARMAPLAPVGNVLVRPWAFKPQGRLGQGLPCAHIPALLPGAPRPQAAS